MSQTPSLIFIASNDEAFQAALTSRNVMKVENLIKQILKDEVLDSAIVLQIKKLSKVAVKAIANTTIQSSTNEELLLQLKHCKEKETQINEQLVDYERYMKSEILAEYAA